MEYTVIDDRESMLSFTELIDLLNEMADNGWEVVCQCQRGIIMRRRVKYISKLAYTYTFSATSKINSGSNASGA